MSNTSRDSSVFETTPPPSETHGGAGKFFLLHVFLQNGRNLPIKDASGSSDPYVKFFYKNKLIYRSHTVYKNINPQWDEKFMHVIDDITVPLRVEVYDYDRLSDDDFMGCATVHLIKVDSNPVELQVLLEDRKKNNNIVGNARDLGYLTVSMQLLPAADSASEELLKKRHSSQTEQDMANETKTKRRTGIRKDAKMWTDLVRIVLIEARNFVQPSTKQGDESYSGSHPPDTFVKFKLGDEKCKSKIVYGSWKPQWLEQFGLHARNDENPILEVVVVDLKKDAAIGRCAIDLTLLPSRKVEKRWYKLDNGISEILLSLSYSGKLASRTVTACDAEDGLLHRFEEASLADVVQSYDVKYTHKNLWDVGYLVVRVHKARGLAAADISNSSDPFCVVELNNARLETHTEHKTKNPEWYTVFTYFVNDINSILEVTVYDEDKYKKSEFLGKVSIPLLNIHNNDQMWYRLKNQHLTRFVKGEILLEMSLVWNPVRAGLATILPPEKKYGVKDDPFRPRICLRNMERLNRFGVMAYDWYMFWQLLLSWEFPEKSMLAFMMLLMAAYSFQPYMIPLGVLGLFGIIGYRRFKTGDMNDENGTEYSKDEVEEMEDEDSTTDDKNWKIIKSYIHLKEFSLMYAQNMMDLQATFMEKVKNILEFKQPFVSWLAIFFMVAGVVVMYFIPLRYLAMGWVIKKFTRKLRRPHSVPSNEVLDFIARAPSDMDLKSYYGYKRDSVADSYINTKIYEHADNKHRSGSFSSKKSGE